MREAGRHVGCRHNCSRGQSSGDAPGRYGCSPCPVDTFQSEALHARTLCTPCGEGQGTAEAGAAACECARGWELEEGSGEGCVPCVPPFYKDWVGNALCLRCGEASGDGSDGSSCECDVGYYDAGEGPELACTPCPRGSTTSGRGARSKQACDLCLWRHMTSDTSSCHNRTDPDPCVCAEGYTKSELACVACPDCLCGSQVPSAAPLPRPRPWLCALAAAALAALLCAREDQ